MLNTDHIQTIQNILTGIEGERDVRILYAVESGSRAWGLDATCRISECPRSRNVSNPHPAGKPDATWPRRRLLSKP